jgi:hypothetical protein
LRAVGAEVGLVVLIQTLHPAAFRPKPGTLAVQRAWYHVAKRIDLEWENLSNVGIGYIGSRCRTLWELMRTQAAIAYDNRNRTQHRDPSQLPQIYISEALGVEHNKAYRKYVPRPYTGDVVLFRASKQLRSRVADDYLGWKPFLNGRLEVCEVYGHQQNLLLEPNVKGLANEVGARLRKFHERYATNRSLASKRPQS